jgi:hypothetical protein
MLCPYALIPHVFMYALSLPSIYPIHAAYQSKPCVCFMCMHSGIVYACMMHAHALCRYWATPYASCIPYAHGTCMLELSIMIHCYNVCTTHIAPKWYSHMIALYGLYVLLHVCMCIVRIQRAFPLDAHARGNMSCLLATHHDALLCVRALLAYQRAVLWLCVYKYTVLHPVHVNALRGMCIDHVHMVHCVVTSCIALIHHALRSHGVYSGVFLIIFIYFNIIT